MFRIRSFLLQTLFAKRFLYLTVLAVFVGLGSIAFSVNSQVTEKAAGNEVTQSNALSDENQSKTEQPKKSCCGGEALAAGEFYTLLGTYYSLKDNQTSVLMFNNKAPQPLTANPVFFSMSGERLELPALTIAAASYQEFDLRELLVNAGQQFQEGSVQVSHQGMKLQLGVQVKILKLERGLIFDEQFVQTSKFVSSRLESVWWLPSPQSKTQLIVSNTTDLPVTTTIKVDGTTPKQREPVTIQLSPHQTRVLDILKDLVGSAHGGTIHKEGGISISHSGTPGAILARMFVSEESAGFSTVVNFIDPQATASSKWNGSGYRVGKIDGEDLTPILVARNVGNESSVISGRLSYTNDEGEVVFVSVPAVTLAANETKLIHVEPEIKHSNVPADITDTGFEFEYSTAPGSVVMTALSASRSGNQVFQVPLFDPNKMGSSAGGYPWKASGDYKTVLYIKNETDQPQKYTASLLYEGGDYTLGIKDIKPHQLVAIDFRALRDSQTADVNGKIIPLNVERGQIGWSSHGKTNRALSGRSHQSSISEGISSTYDCRNCCPNSVYDGWVTPGETINEIGDIADFTANQRDTNCYGQIMPGYPSVVYWESADPSIASTNYFSGQTNLLDAGETTVQASWTADHWFLGLNYQCEYTPVSMQEQAYVDVLAKPSANIDSFDAVGVNSSNTDFSATVKITVDNPNNLPITLTLAANSGTTGVAYFSDTNSPTKTIFQTTNVQIKGITESSTSGNMRLKATYNKNGDDVSLDSEDFTVISVELSLKYTDQVSSDNSKRNNYNTRLGTYDLGGPFLSFGNAATKWRIGIEIKGSVLPSNFSKKLVFNREIVSLTTYTRVNYTPNWTASLICPNTNPPLTAPCPDTSDAILIDDDPSVQSRLNARI